MNSKKVKAITSWKKPINVKNIQAFIGFTNFYWRFIKNFLRLMTPLICLTQKDILFQFDKTCKAVFQALKNAFISASILCYFDSDLKCMIKADSSDYAHDNILSQYDFKEMLHSVVYFSHCLNPAECNYKIYNKKLLAIICCFEQWHLELEGTIFLIQVLSDHKNLQYFCTTKQLSHWQACWSEYLFWFHFLIVYWSEL